MLNQAKPASLSGSNSGRTLVLLLPSSNPPPWIRMAAANGPGPSGTCRSSSNGWPTGRAYSTSFLSRGAAARVAAQAIARMKAGVRMEDDCIRGGTGLLACPSSCYKCVVSYYERHLPHWQPEGAALFLTWRLARIAPENRAICHTGNLRVLLYSSRGGWHGSLPKTVRILVLPGSSCLSRSGPGNGSGISPVRKCWARRPVWHFWRVPWRPLTASFPASFSLCCQPSAGSGGAVDRFLRDMARFRCSRRPRRLPPRPRLEGWCPVAAAFPEVPSPPPRGRAAPAPAPTYAENHPRP